MKPKAILLDLDDTIIAFDHGVDLTLCWHQVCRKHLPHLKEKEIEAVVLSIRKQAQWYWSDPDRHQRGRMDLHLAREEIISVALDPLHLSDATIAQRIAIDYGNDRDNAIRLYPLAVETLHQLREMGMKLALITNGAAEAQRQKVERFHLAPFFEAILIEGEVGIGKPDPKVYLHALQKLGMSAEEVWMVGDNYEWEVEAPQKLGIRSIWVNPLGKEAPSGEKPYRSIATFSEIIPLLENEN